MLAAAWVIKYNGDYASHLSLAVEAPPDYARRIDREAIHPKNLQAHVFHRWAEDGWRRPICILATVLLNIIVDGGYKQRSPFTLQN